MLETMACVGEPTVLDSCTCGLGMHPFFRCGVCVLVSSCLLEMEMLKEDGDGDLAVSFCRPTSRISVMGGEQAASVLSTVCSMPKKEKACQRTLAIVVTAAFCTL